jgi:hypothetical protein
MLNGARQTVDLTPPVRFGGRLIGISSLMSAAVVVKDAQVASHVTLPRGRARPEPPGRRRGERRRIQALFRSDPEIRVLVATDAAGEGVNLQNANLMVNYDLILPAGGEGMRVGDSPPRPFAQRGKGPAASFGMQLTSVMAPGSRPRTGRALRRTSFDWTGIGLVARVDGA